MANKFAQGAINFSGTWYTLPSGGSTTTKPVAGDTAVLNNQAVTIDEDVTCDLITNAVVGGSTVGGTLSVTASRTITAGLTHAKASTNMLYLNTAAATLNIVIPAGSLLYGNGAGGSCVRRDTGTLTITGAIHAAGNNCTAVASNAAGTGSTTIVGKCTTGNGSATGRPVAIAVYGGTVNWINQSVTLDAGEECFCFVGGGTLNISGLVVTNNGRFVIQGGGGTLTTDGVTAIIQQIAAAQAAGIGGVVLPITGPTLPAVGNVLSGVGTFGYAGTLLTPTLTLSAEALTAAGTIYGVGGTGSTGSYPLTATTQAADASTLDAQKAYLLATRTVTFGASSVIGTLAVANVLSDVTGGIYHAPEAAEVISTAVFGPASGTAGTYVDPANGNVRKGVSVGVNPRVGTLVGCVDTNGVNQGTSGVLDESSIYHDYGIMDDDGVFKGTMGMLDEYINYYATGVLSGSSVYHANGVLETDGDYADLSDYVHKLDIVGSENVVEDVPRWPGATGPDLGEYPTTATSQAAQLATDQAAVSSASDNIDGGVTIIGVEGTGVNATTLLSTLGMATGNMDLAIGTLATTDQLESAIWAQTRFRFSIPEKIEAPESGTTTYTFGLDTYNTAGALADCNGTPTVTAQYSDGTSAAALLGAVTNVATGKYRFTLAVAYDIAVPLWLGFYGSGTQGGDAIGMSDYTWIVDDVGVGFTQTDANNIADAKSAAEAVEAKLPAGGALMHATGAAVAKSPATLDWTADVTSKPTIGTSTLTTADIPTTSAITTAAWNVLTSTLTTAGSIGKWLLDRIPTASGAYTITFTVTDGTDPLETVTIRATKGSNSYTATTNASGVATLSLDAGTWSIAMTLAGYSFTAVNLVVAATAPVAYTMTEVSIPASNPTFVTGYLTCYDEDGVIEAGAVVDLQFKSAAGQGHGYDRKTRSETSSALGLASFTNLVVGATYLLRRGSASDWTEVTIPSTATSPYALDDLVGEEDA